MKPWVTSYNGQRRKWVIAPVLGHIWYHVVKIGESAFKKLCYFFGRGKVVETIFIPIKRHKQSAGKGAVEIGERN